MLNTVRRLAGAVGVDMVEGGGRGVPDAGNGRGRGHGGELQSQNI